jgi:hypothetical protein
MLFFLPLNYADLLCGALHFDEDNKSKPEFPAFAFQSLAVRKRPAFATLNDTKKGISEIKKGP